MALQDYFSIINMLSNIALIVLSLDHLLTGFICLFFPGKSERLAKKLFGVTIVDKEFYKVIIRPWGALGLFAAGVGILPVLDPSRYKAVSLMLMLLLFFRLYYRFNESKKARQVLELSLKRNLVHMFLIFLCLLAALEKIMYF